MLYRMEGDEMNRRYYVRWFSVDGAGTYPDSFASQEDAARFADARAHESNTRVHGAGWVNPWDYSYLVCDERSQTLYRANYVRAYRVEEVSA